MTDSTPLQNVLNGENTHFSRIHRNMYLERSPERLIPNERTFVSVYRTMGDFKLDEFILQK